MTYRDYNSYLWVWIMRFMGPNDVTHHLGFGMFYFLFFCLFTYILHYYRYLWVCGNLPQLQRLHMSRDNEVYGPKQKKIKHEIKQPWPARWINPPNPGKVKERIKLCTKIMPDCLYCAHGISAESKPTAPSSTSPARLKGPRDFFPPNWRILQFERQARCSS